MTSTSPASPRTPTTDERRQLAEWLRQQGYHPDDAASTANTAYVAVFDDYATGSPGYVGKVMSVVWDSGPSFFDVFIWEHGKFTCVERE